MVLQGNLGVSIDPASSDLELCANFIGQVEGAGLGRLLVVPVCDEDVLSSKMPVSAVRGPNGQSSQNWAEDRLAGRRCRLRSSLYSRQDGLFWQEGKDDPDLS